MARVAARFEHSIHRFQEPALPGLRVQVLHEFPSSNFAAFGSWGPPEHIPVPAGPRRDSPSSLLSGCFRSQESCYSWLLFIGPLSHVVLRLSACPYPPVHRSSLVTWLRPCSSLQSDSQTNLFCAFIPQNDVTQGPWAKWNNSWVFARHLAMAKLLTPVGQQVTPARRPCSPTWMFAGHRTAHIPLWRTFAGRWHHPTWTFAG